VLRSEGKIDLLQRVPLFAGCSRRELVQIARASDEVDFAAGRTLIEEGSVGQEFFVVIDGSVDVRRKGRKIDELGSGDYFGEVALITDRPRNATVTTTSHVRALVLTKRKFRQLLAQNPLLSVKVLNSVGERLPPEHT
jgi:CRP/FNR family transcriptional regulator, cyclic AMP receptor protein